jgi:DNA ligase-1
MITERLLFMPTLFRSVSELLEEVASTRKRLRIIGLVSDFLDVLHVEEIEPAVSMILGRPFPKWNQDTMEVSWATLSELLRKITEVDSKVFVEAFRKTGDVGSAAQAVFEGSKLKRQTVLFKKALTIMEVRRSLEAIAATAGSGAREKKERLITYLLGQASSVEAKYLVRLFIGEMRTGLHEGLMQQAISKSFEIPLATIQRASMTIGDIGEAATIAKTEGEAGLSKVGFKVFRPVTLMLAQTADDVREALEEHGGRTAFEYKYDGARVQIHKLGSEVRIFSRRLTDATWSLPEIVETVKREVKAKEAILEGEVVAVNDSGHPIPFQHLMRRFKRVHEIEDTAQKIPVKLYLFDVLYLDGKSLIPVPYLARRKILAETAGKIPLSSQIITDRKEKAEKFLAEAMDAGHEGLMAKKLEGPYVPGTRGKHWLKIKPVLEPLDLVIVAAEYGYGRRHDWLSDYYLAARDAQTGEFLNVGKTFKGLTDAEIIEMTRRLKDSTIRTEGHGRVVVVPSIVVEVAYNEIQKSQKYKSEMALRFARITRVRDDKLPQDADTIAKVREIYESQFKKKGKYRTDQHIDNNPQRGEKRDGFR